MGAIVLPSRPHSYLTHTHSPQKYDLYHGPPGRRNGALKPNVVLSSYETVLKERSLFQVCHVESRVPRCGSCAQLHATGLKPRGWFQAGRCI